ncbi:MAG: HupE/UreJ family protein [Burkholderiales bacterium]
MMRHAIQRAFPLLVLLAAYACGALAHEVRPAYLELRQSGLETYDVLWKVPGRGEDLRLALYVEFPADTVELTPPRASFVNNAFFERWSVKRAGGLGGGAIRIAGLNATLTNALVRLERLDGAVQIARLTPASPSFVVGTSPDKLQVAVTYVRLGIEHILGGYDHMLFVFALILIVRGGKKLVWTVTAFTLAHSITLALATLGMVQVPGPPVEATIALSILLLATEIVRLERGQGSLTARWPWVVAFAFGLLHGFGFAGALSEIGLPHGEIPLALAAFNVGVELGQLAFIAGVFAVRSLARRIELPALVGRVAKPAASYAIGTLAAFWFFERLLRFST